MERRFRITFAASLLVLMVAVYCATTWLRETGEPPAKLTPRTQQENDPMHAVRGSGVVSELAEVAFQVNQPAEESRLNRSLNVAESEVNRVGASAALEGSQDGANNEATASMPLVFGLAEAATLNLDEGQQQAVEELREQFVAEVGGLNQSPTTLLTAPGGEDRNQR